MLWERLRRWLGQAGRGLDLRDVLVSMALGWLVVQIVQALAGPLPYVAASLLGLAVSLLALLVVPRLPLGW